MPDVWNRLTDLWRAQEIALPAGVTPSAIRDFEAKHGVVVPADLRAYFETVDGTGDDYDDMFNNFWSLKDVAPVGEVIADKGFDRSFNPDRFIFADHSICLFCWAVQLGQEPVERSGPVFVISDYDGTGHADYEVAPSFSRFIEMYLMDRGSVF